MGAAALSCTSCSSCCAKHEELLHEHLDTAITSVSEVVLLEPRKRCIAMQGGGFRAQMSDLGLIAGLLAFSGASKLSESKIFSGFDTLSTCSGSSWFAASLIYSPYFVELLEGMSQKPDVAARLFHCKYVKPFLAAANKDDNALVRILADLVKLFDKGRGEDIALLGYLWEDGTSWKATVELLLQTTAQIDMKKTTMGSEPCPWAKDKTWMCNATFLSPAAPEEAVTLWREGPLDGSHATYMLQDATAPAGTVPTFTPARFSIVLGSKEPAPLFFISPDGLSHEATLKYTGQEHAKVFNADCKKKIVTSASEAIDSFPTAQDTVADIPLGGPVAASSAAFGKVVLDPKLAWEAQRFQLCPWFSNAGGAESFSKATSLVQQLLDAKTVDQTDVDDFAKFQLRGLLDSGDSDGTGLLNAISVNSGCDEVTVVLNAGYIDQISSFLLKMFKDFDAKWYPKEPPRGSDHILFPTSGVFASPPAASIKDDFAQNKGFWEVQNMKDQDANHFLGMKVGTIKARTNASKWFNIDAGIDVTINVVQIASNLTMGQLEDFDFYGALAQEIICAILHPHNQEVVSKKLMPMLAAA